MLLVKGGEGFEGDLFPGSGDFLSVVGELVAVTAKAGVVPPGEGEFSEGVEGGGLAEGFLEPFVLLSIGPEAGADVGELVRELVDHL